MGDDERPFHEQIEDVLTKDTDGGFITGWLVAARYIDSDGEPGWFFYVPGDQDPADSQALSEYVANELFFKQFQQYNERQENQ